MQINADKITRSGTLEKYLREKMKVGGTLKVGFTSRARYPDGTSVALVAYKNETGAGGIPRRPFMHRTLDLYGEEWADGIINAMRGNFSQASAARAFNLVGHNAAVNMAQVITAWDPSDPRLNSPITIAAKRAGARKGKNLRAIDPRTALIDTSTMISNISYKVEL